MKQRGVGFFQVSLMNVFRQAAMQRDAKSLKDTVADDGGRVLSARTVERRDGASQETLKSHLAQDLASLMGTINLEAVQALDGLDHVRNSILNYGLQDMSALTTESFQTAKVIKDMRTSLLANEPRLIEETLDIKFRRNTADAQQRIAFDIKAEMSARPMDVPMEFVAEIDAGAGKVQMTDVVMR